jgi:hypothetical protein
VSGDRSGRTVLPENLKPAIGVNNRGVVGVTWQSRRGLTPDFLAAPWFSASMDGGISWLPSVPIASAAPRAPAHADIRFIFAQPDADSSSRSVTVGYFAPQGPLLFSDLGSLTFGADGVFHTFWNDYRTGAPELWSAGVTVEGRALLHGDAALADYIDVTGRTKINYELGASTVDGAWRTITFDARIRNVSKTPVRGPIKLRVTSLAPINPDTPLRE